MSDPREPLLSRKLRASPPPADWQQRVRQAAKRELDRQFGALPAAAGSRASERFRAWLSSLGGMAGVPRFAIAAAALAIVTAGGWWGGNAWKTRELGSVLESGAMIEDAALLADLDLLEAMDELSTLGATSESADTPSAPRPPQTDADWESLWNRLDPERGA